MKNSLLPIPNWLITSLQGLTFWIGYKRALYRGYPLPEGALATELRSLLHANLPDELFLKCEVAYSKIVDGLPRPKPIAGSARVDLMVASRIDTKDPSNRWQYEPEYVFELKLAKATNTLIDKDLSRLAAFQATRKGVRAFLIVLSEADRHNRFVTDKGQTHKGTHKVPDSDGTYMIRRTVKAASAYVNRDKGNYATMVEVFAET
jgi:hypothetical protein